jgi:CHAT domain-containing protein
MQTRLQAEVLVLSACETGVVDVQGGDELVGLTAAFLQAGARGLVVSLWAVDDESTATLMTAFYAARQDRADTARALRLAMDKVLASGQWSHPYYWGAFSFVGAWQRQAVHNLEAGGADVATGS